MRSVDFLSYAGSSSTRRLGRSHHNPRSLARRLLRLVQAVRNNPQDLKLEDATFVTNPGIWLTGASKRDQRVVDGRLHRTGRVQNKCNLMQGHAQHNGRRKQIQSTCCSPCQRRRLFVKCGLQTRGVFLKVQVSWYKVCQLMVSLTVVQILLLLEEISSGRLLPWLVSRSVISRKRIGLPEPMIRRHLHWMVEWTWISRLMVRQ